MIRTMSGSSPDGENVSSSGPNKGMDPGKGCQGQNARIETQPREGRGLDKSPKSAKNREGSVPNRQLHVYADQDTLCKANSLTFVGTRLEIPVKDGSTIIVEPNKGNKSTV